MAELYHLGVPTSAVPGLAVLVDPLLPVAPAVAAMKGRALASRREYISYLGAWDSQDVLVTTIGVGAPPLAIALEELTRAGARAVVLVGTASFRDAAASVWLIPHGAARRDGTSAQYAPVQFPAAPHPQLRACLADACGAAASYGLVETVDVLDGGQRTNDPAAAQDLRCAALFVVASARRVEAAALLVDPDGTDAVDGDVSSDMVGAMAVAAYRALAASTKRRVEHHDE